MAFFGYFQGHGDLVFDPTWPIFELDLAIIEIKLLTNIEEYQSKNESFRVITSLKWLVLAISKVTVTQFLTPHDPISNLTLSFSKYNFWAKLIDINAKLKVLECLHAKNGNFWLFPRSQWPSFWPHLTHFRTWPKYHWNVSFDQVWSTSMQKWKF